MPKKTTCPRLLTDVLQAIADVGGAQGCTVRKILKQVEESIVVKNIKPKPRNVVMQVKKAVNHGIDKGLLQQKYGKVYLILGRKKNKPIVHKRKKNAHEVLCNRTEDRQKKHKHRVKRDDTHSSDYSRYFPSSHPRSTISPDVDSYSDRRRSRRIQKKVASHRRKHRNVSPGSSHSSRTSKNCIELPHDDEVNVNLAEEANDVCGNPDCYCNPNRM